MGPATRGAKITAPEPLHPPAKVVGSKQNGGSGSDTRNLDPMILDPVIQERAVRTSKPNEGKRDRSFFGVKKKVAERSDVELIQAYQSGDERAYAELYTRHKSEVYTFCLRMVGGDPDVASDAFQEVFIKIYEKAGTFRDGNNVMGWVYMIARNTCLNIHRSKKPNDALDNYDSLVSSDRTMGPEFAQEQTFLRELLEKAIAQLPHEFREPFILREFDGFGYDEIAKMTDTTLAVTKVRIHRAKQKMREMLRPYLQDDDTITTE